MGLAPYGRPIYADLIRQRLLDVKPDGSFRVDLQYFEYHRGLTMTSRALDRLFGGPPREPESPITQREMDVAASIQQVTDEIMLAAARHVHELTGLTNLCMAGGVALNCVSNGRILREGPFERLWIQPAAGDAGGALGVALLIWHQLLDNPRTAQPHDSQQGSFLGPAFSDSQIQQFLDRTGVEYLDCQSEDDLCARVSDLLAHQKVVGWFQGRMEFGPRALGARSILGDARSPVMQSVLNQKIKVRESFRPFAPAVLAEHAAEYFDISGDVESPYMLLVTPVASAQRISADESEPVSGLDMLRQPRSTIPAVTHVDNSARVQMVDVERHGRFRKVLERFHAKTGCPVLINTSFNVRGEPIVCTPEEAYGCFQATQMDALVLGRFVLLKQGTNDPHAREAHLRQFVLD
jgi:carbamoyltransferase